MSAYLGYLFSGADQFLILIGGVLCWLGLASIGGLVVGRDRLGEGDVISGWAVAILLFSVPGAFLGVPFKPIFWGLAAVALVSMFVPFRRDERVLPAGALQAIVLALPLLVIAAARSGSEWDEFSQWIPMAKHLFQGDGFPAGTLGTLGLTFPAYPYGWPILAYMPQRLVGEFVESAGAVMNLLLLIAVGLLAVRLWLLGAGRDAAARRSWAACAFAVLAGTIMSPTFVEKVALTYYADVPTAVAVAFVGVLGWMILEALADGRDRSAWRYAWQFGLAGLVLVDVKQVNVVILATILGGMGLVALRDRAIRLWRLIVLAPVMVIPAAVIFGVWKFYVATTYAGVVEPVFKPLMEWQWDLAWQVLARMAQVAANKGGYFGVMTITTVLGVWGLVRLRGSLGRFAIVVAAAFVGYNAFLFVTYIGFFGADDALRAASFWRYNMHLGLLATVFAAYVGGVLLRRMPEGRWWGRAVGIFAIVAVIAAPFGFAKVLRFDLVQPKPFYRAVARDFAAGLKDGEMIRPLLLDPYGSGESKGFTRFALMGHLDADIPYFSAFQDTSIDLIRNAILSVAPTHILVHSVDPIVSEALGLSLKSDLSYLLVPDGGGWRVVKAWRHPDGPGFGG